VPASAGPIAGNVFSWPRPQALRHSSTPVHARLTDGTTSVHRQLSIDDPDQLEHLKAAGRVVPEAIRAMRAAVAPGVTTGELDEIGGRVFRRAGARSGPQLDYNFPGGQLHQRVNEEAVHGIP
jgi:hypothetical protein